VDASRGRKRDRHVGELAARGKRAFDARKVDEVAADVGIAGAGPYERLESKQALAAAATLTNRRWS
jgi:hypothetical protein